MIFLELTEEGRALSTHVPYFMADSLNRHLRDFSQQELDELKRLLRKLTANGEN